MWTRRGSRARSRSAGVRRPHSGTSARSGIRPGVVSDRLGRGDGGGGRRTFAPMTLSLPSPNTSAGRGRAGRRAHGRRSAPAAERRRPMWAAGRTRVGGFSRRCGGANRARGRRPRSSTASPGWMRAPAALRPLRPRSPHTPSASRRGVAWRGVARTRPPAPRRGARHARHGRRARAAARARARPGGGRAARAAGTAAALRDHAPRAAGQQRRRARDPAAGARGQDLALRRAPRRGAAAREPGRARRGRAAGLRPTRASTSRRT